MQYLLDHIYESDVSISKRFGVKPSTIHSLRRELGLPSSASGGAQAISICQVQYIIDQHSAMSVSAIAEGLDISYTSTKAILRELLGTEKRKYGRIRETSATPWQLAKKAKYEPQRTAALLERHGYGDDWGTRDVAWLCSREGRLHYG